MFKLNIVIANPPAFFSDCPDRHFFASGSRWSFSFDAPKDGHKFPHYQPYPFNLAYAVSILKQEGKEVEGLDGCALDMDEKEWCEAIIDKEPTHLVVEVPTISFSLMEPILEHLYGVLKCRITVVGPHVSAFPQYILFHSIKGEWENRVGDIKLDFKQYPHPDRAFFPNERYSNFEFYRPSSQMITSKGCPSHCTFCVERHVIYGNNKVRTRSAEDIVDEMEEVVALGAKQIWFDDMSLTSVKPHIEGLCKEILKRGFDTPWTAMGDMNASEETIRLMAKARCIGLAFGVETVNPMALRGIGKTWVTPELATSFTKLLRENNIYSVATYTLGLPNENVKTLKDTVDFAFELDTDSLQFSIATPFPRTPFYHLCEVNGYLRTRDWTMYDGARHCVVDYPQLSHDEIEESYREAMERRKREQRGFRK